MHRGEVVRGRDLVGLVLLFDQLGGLVDRLLGGREVLAAMDHREALEGERLGAVVSTEILRGEERARGDTEIVPVLELEVDARAAKLRVERVGATRRGRGERAETIARVFVLLEVLAAERGVVRGCATE